VGNVVLVLKVAPISLVGNLMGKVFVAVSSAHCLMLASV
jgi:hypothetical protein